MEMLKFELVFSCLLCLAHSTLFAGGRIRLSKLKCHSICRDNPYLLSSRMLLGVLVLLLIKIKKHTGL